MANVKKKPHDFGKLVSLINTLTDIYKETSDVLSEGNCENLKGSINLITYKINEYIHKEQYNQ
tara:strand:- start:11 stop:199 length:189 start_codon:yes stop_codon:yes gene_type:complete